MCFCVFRICWCWGQIPGHGCQWEHWIFRYGAHWLLLLQSVFTCLWLLWSHINYCKIDMSAWLSLEGWSNSRCSHGQKWFIRGWQDCFCMFVGIVRVGVCVILYGGQFNKSRARCGVQNSNTNSTSSEKQQWLQTDKSQEAEQQDLQYTCTHTCCCHFCTP